MMDRRKSLGDKSGAYYAHGELRFTDAFGKHRWVKYRYMAGGRAGLDPSGFVVTCEEGNETSEDEETGLSPTPSPVIL